MKYRCVQEIWMVTKLKREKKSQVDSAYDDQKLPTYLCNFWYYTKRLMKIVNFFLKECLYHELI